jgi:hypothetical protein
MLVLRPASPKRMQRENHRSTLCGDRGDRCGHVRACCPRLRPVCGCLQGTPARPSLPARDRRCPTAGLLPQPAPTPCRSLQRTPVRPPPAARTWTCPPPPPRPAREPSSRPAHPAAVPAPPHPARERPGWPARPAAAAAPPRLAGERPGWPACPCSALARARPAGPVPSPAKPPAGSPATPGSPGSSPTAPASRWTSAAAPARSRPPCAPRWPCATAAASSPAATAHHRGPTPTTCSTWADGGPTSLDNLALLCRRHHRTVHERRWQLTRRPDGKWAAAPPSQAIPPRPQAA